MYVFLSVLVNVFYKRRKRLSFKTAPSFDLTKYLTKQYYETKLLKIYMNTSS